MLGLGGGLEHQSASGGARQTIYSITFDTAETSSFVKGANNNYGTFMSNQGWITSWSLNNGNGTLYGSQLTSNINNLTSGWALNNNRTSSAGTGAGGGMLGGIDATNGDHKPASDTSTHGKNYLYYEASSAGSGTGVVRAMVGLPELDLSNYSQVEMDFWVHAYGVAFGGGVGMGIAATTSATSASSADQAGAGLGFTSDTAGGAQITYTKLGAGSPTTTQRIGSDGQLQTSGGDNLDASVESTSWWVPAKAILHNASGVSGVRIFLGMFTQGIVGNNDWKQDVCIDNINITGII